MRPLLVRTRISSSAEALATSCRLVPRMNSLSSLSRVRLLSLPPLLHIPLQRDLNSASPNPVNCYLLEVVPLTTLCVVLFRQHLHTSLQRREIQSSPETVFSCSQFNVEFDFIAFLRMQARVLQVKLLYGSLLFSAISILCHVLLILAFQLTVELCNRPSGF